MNDQRTTVAQGWVELLFSRSKEIEAIRESPRVDSLPDMIRRNGLIQVLLFLEAKGRKKEDDRQLAELLRSLVTNAPHQKFEANDLSPEHLSKLSFASYLLREEIAIEAASWLARWIQAQRAEASLIEEKKEAHDADDAQ